MRPCKSEKGLTFFFAASLLLLVFAVAHLWIFQKGPPSFSPSSSGELSSRFSVQLEEAKVSKIGEKGKEWELWAASIEQKGDEVSLREVSGIIFQETTPLYRLNARRGVLSLSSGDATLWEVELREEKGGRTIWGETLSFLSQEKKFILYQVNFQSSDMEARCGKLVYNVAQRKMVWEENVEIKMGLP